MVKTQQKKGGSGINGLNYLIPQAQLGNTKSVEIRPDSRWSDS